MPPGRMRVTRHEIYAPFRKKAYGNDRVQREGWRAHLALKNLARMTFSECNNTVFEYRRPEVARTQNLLGDDISGHVTTIDATMAVIQDSFSLFQGQAPVEH